ncbi:hypothetical protein V8C86DRAFT_979000 [Haematococcus lacustris]
MCAAWCAARTSTGCWSRVGWCRLQPCRLRWLCNGACWGLRRGRGWMTTGWRIQSTGAGCCAMRCTLPERWRQPWQPGSWIWCLGSRLSSPTQGCCQGPPRPPTPYALTPTSKCQARHVFIDTMGLYGMMHDAGMLGVLTEEGVTSLKKFRNGALPDPAVPGNFIAGPKDSHVSAPCSQVLASAAAAALAAGVSQSARCGKRQ